MANRAQNIGLRRHQARLCCMFLSWNGRVCYGRRGWLNIGGGSAGDNWSSVARVSTNHMLSTRRWAAKHEAN